MKGWDLKEGEILKKDLNNEEMIDLFYNFFQKKTKMNNLYKLFLLKSVLECSEFQEENLFEKIYHNFGKNYWNFTTKVNFNINTSRGKITTQKKIILDIKNTIGINFSNHFNENLDFLKQQYLNDTKKNLKTYVVGALYGDFKGIIYSFNKKENIIILNENLREFMFKNKKILFELIDYKIIEFLKLVNKKSDLENLKILNDYHLNIENDLYEKIDLIFSDLKKNKEESALDIAKKNKDLIMELLKKFK